MPHNIFHEMFIDMAWVEAKYTMEWEDDENKEEEVEFIISNLMEKEPLQGRTPLHVLAANSATRTPTLAAVASEMVFLYPLALTTKDDNHETPLEIAVANSSYPEIIKLLSITNLETLDQDELDRQYASEEYHVGQALKLIHAEDWPACIEFLDSKKPDDQFIFELLSYNLCGTTIIHEIAICSQKYHDDLVFLLLRLVHRHPPALHTQAEDENDYEVDEDDEFPWDTTPAEFARCEDACQEVQNILALSPENDFTEGNFNALLARFLPPLYEEYFASYNTVCQFLRHCVSPHDKAELVEISPNTPATTPTYLAMRVLYNLSHEMSLGPSIGNIILEFLLVDVR